MLRKVEELSFTTLTDSAKLVLLKLGPQTGYTVCCRSVHLQEDGRKVSKHLKDILSSFCSHRSRRLSQGLPVNTLSISGNLFPC